MHLAYQLKDHEARNRKCLIDRTKCNYILNTFLPFLNYSYQAVSSVVAYAKPTLVFGQ